MTNPIFDAWNDSVERLVSAAICSGFNPISVLLAAAPPPPDVIARNPYLGALFEPGNCLNPWLPPQDSILGGQCPDVLYTVSIEFTRANGSVLPVTINNIRGPIRGADVIWRDFPNVFEPGAYPFARIVGSGAPPSNEALFGPSGPRDNGRVSRVRITDITGGPNNCGNRQPFPILPPVPTVPVPPITVPPVPFPLPGFPNLVIGGVLAFLPIINLPRFGGLHIPINVTLLPNAAINVPVTFPVYLQLPSLNINAGISFGLPINVNGEINIGLPGSGGGDEGEFTDRIIGVDTTATVAPISRVSTIVGTAQASSLNVPYLGIVRFRPPAFVSNRESIDVPIKTLQQFTPVPWFYGAESYTILPNSGVTITDTARRARVAEFYKPV